VCEPIFQKPIGDISFGQLLLQLFRTASRFDMEVQPSLVLLQKTLLNVEGLGKQLYPDLDLWQTAYPFLENWQKQRLSPLNNLRKVREKLPEWLEQAPEIPELVHEALLSAGGQRARLQAMEERVKTLEAAQAATRYRNAAVFLVLALVLLALFPGAATWLAALSLPVVALGAGAALWWLLRR
jgi:ubiquinone biosynthesis protein